MAGMAMETLISVAVYFALMLGIGIYAWRKSTSNIAGYLLGGRDLGPAVTALSAGASDMSGWLLLGLPGALFLTGLSASWIAIGLLAGALANYLIVAPRLRVHTELAGDAITIPDFLEKRFADHSRALRLVSSIVIVIFFTLYTSSGMVAGGKLFVSAFGADYRVGLLITAAVVVAYVALGGFLAVSLTDVVQGSLMLIALILVPLMAYGAIDWPEGFFATLTRIDPTLTQIFAGTSVLGIISAAAWGLGYFGQPHIIVRFMAIRSVRDMPTARTIGMSWMAVCLAGAVAVGLVGRGYASWFAIVVDDPETIFILLGSRLFPPLVFGVLLAAILAAIMSTISAQLLVTSSSLTEDFYKVFLRRDASQRELVGVGRASVVAVAVIAIVLAWNPDSSVLDLVANAWAGFGAAFGPVIILSLNWRRMTRSGALAGMIAGAATVLFWIYAPVLADGKTLSSVIYEIVPGFIACWIAIMVVSLAGTPPAGTVVETFDKARAALRG